MSDRFGPRQLYTALQLKIEFYDRYSNNAITGGGTGFIVHSPDGRYLITNRHVVDRSFDDPGGKYAAYTFDSIELTGFEEGIYGDDTVSTAEKKVITVKPVTPIWPADDTLDIAVIPLSDANVAAEDDERAYWSFHSFPINQLSTSWEVSAGGINVGSPILMPGYPSHRNRVADRPILVSGSIASDPRYPAAYGENVYSNRVLCHSFSREGMSGAPVLTHVPAHINALDIEVDEKLTVLGINTGHIHLSNEPSVLSLFVPAPAILATLAQAGDEDATRTASLWTAIHFGRGGDLWTPNFSDEK